MDELGESLVENDEMSTPPELTSLGTRKRRRLIPHMSSTAILWAIMVAIALLVGVPATVLMVINSGETTTTTFVATSTCFVIVSVPLSVYDISQHLSNYWQPVLQQYVIRIIWMVPIYAICSYMSLVLWVTNMVLRNSSMKECEELSLIQEQYTYIPNAFRECYEAYTVYNFLKYLTTFLEIYHGESASSVLEKSHPGIEAVSHFFPFRIVYPTRCTDGRPGGFQTIKFLFDDWSLQSNEFVYKCGFGVNLYVALIPFSALISVVFSLSDLYHEGNMSFGSLYLWNESFVLIFSSYAIYCLVLFYHIAVGDLAPTSPLLKFVCVKGIVFFTFFQNFAIALYFHIHQVNDYERTVGVVQATVMCVEMCIFAIGHHYAFPVSEYPRVTEDSCRGDWQRWLVEWGNYYATTAHSSNHISFSEYQELHHRREMSFSTMLDIRDVHADTKKAWKEISAGVSKVSQHVRKHVPDTVFTPRPNNDRSAYQAPAADSEGQDSEEDEL